MNRKFSKARTIIIICLMILLCGICLYIHLSKNGNKTKSVNDTTLYRINEIRDTPNTDIRNLTGNIYYLSNCGDDNADGKTPQTAWKTLEKLQSEFSTKIKSGDCILFNRGDVFRGNINVTQDNITIGSYGDESKAKPEINVSIIDGAKEGNWSQIKPNIWKYSEKISNDVGVIWFFKNDNSLTYKFNWSNYSYNIGQKISFDSTIDENTLDLSTILDSDLEFYHTGMASSGINTGEYIYVYSQTNPQERFDRIEFARGVNGIYGKTNLLVDNIKIVFAGNHGIGTGTVANLTVTNCEFGFIGGSRQNQNNVRFGNAIEIYGQVKETNEYEVSNGFIAKNNYIYEIYDAGITFQYTANTTSSIVEKAEFLDNVIEKCNYSIEYWNVSKSNEEDKQKSYIGYYRIANNIFRYSGYGVSQTRPDKTNSAHIKTWVHDAEYENKINNSFVVEDNIFYTSSEQMFSIFACDKNSLPKIIKNTFYNDDNVPLGYFYYNGLDKKKIPYVKNKTIAFLPGNDFYYTSNIKEEVLRGDSGEVIWSFDMISGILEISGSGEMQDYTKYQLPNWCNFPNFVKEIIIGENITKLGNYAFYNLFYVERITINSARLQNLSNDVINFNNGNNFTFYNVGREWYGIKVIFGKSVERIASFLFWPTGSSNEAPYITNIKFESSKIKEIGNHSLAGISCQSIEIPEGVEILGVLAISNSSKLKSVKLPKSLITLSGWCFAGNYYLESVIIEENISSLNENLFFGDVNLKQLILKGNISEMANVKNIFSIEAKNITLYGNESVKKFVQKYNENNVEHKIYYAQLEDLYKSS